MMHSHWCSTLHSASAPSTVLLICSAQGLLLAWCSLWCRSGRFGGFPTKRGKTQARTQRSPVRTAWAAGQRRWVRAPLPVQLSCAPRTNSKTKRQKKKNTKPTTTEQPHSRRALRRARLICCDLSTSYREKSAGERFPLQALRWGTVLLSAAFVSQWGLLQHTPAPLQPHISAVWCLRYNPS